MYIVYTLPVLICNNCSNFNKLENTRNTNICGNLVSFLSQQVWFQKTGTRKDFYISYYRLLFLK